jgi:predicted ATPase
VHRLVTLTGTGGVGKTRLAAAVAVEQDGMRRDGARMVALAGVGTSAAVPAAVAAVLDLQRRPERSLTDSIIDVLGPAELLLVLDNGEHVLEAVADLVREVLPRCPEVTVLTTSREPLGLPEEVVRVVPPLGTPASEAAPDEVRAAPAVVLFAQRAAAASPGFVVDAATLAAVAEICIRLDGVPLALELAAARLRSMAPADLARRLGARFRLLAGPRSADPRHRALHDVVAWSHGLLAPEERELFARLGVFAGSFDLERVEAVCAGGGLGRDDVAALLSALVDKSMVVADGAGGRMRYRLLETLREFARDRLDGSEDAPAVRAAHARSHLDGARVAAAGLDGPDEAAHQRALAADFADLREVVDRSLARHDLDTAIGIVTAMREFTFRSVRYEVLGWARAVLDAPDVEQHPGHPVVAAMVAYGHFVRGELSRAESWARTALDAARAHGSTTEGLAQRVLGNALFFRGRRDEALDWMDQMTRVVQETGRDGRLAHVAYMASVARSSIGDDDAARHYAREARAAAERCGSATAAAQSAYAEALVLEPDEPARAADLLGAGAAAAAGAGNRWMHAFARTEELALRARSGDPAGTLAGFREVVDTWFRGGDWANQWLSLRHLTPVFAEVGDLTTTGLLEGAIAAAGATSALPFAPSTAARSAALVASARSRDPAAFDAAAARGRVLADDAVVRHVLAVLDGRDVDDG